MTDNIEKAASSGDFFIWSITFGLLVVVVGYLAYISKDYEK